MNRWGINVGDNVSLIGISMVIRRKATKRRKVNEVCGTRRGGRIGCYHNCTLTLSHCIAHPRGHLLPIEFFPRIIVDRVDCKGGSISSSLATNRKRKRKKEREEGKKGKFWDSRDYSSLCSLVGKMVVGNGDRQKERLHR